MIREMVPGEASGSKEEEVFKLDLNNLRLEYLDSKLNEVELIIHHAQNEIDRAQCSLSTMLIVIKDHPEMQPALKSDLEIAQHILAILYSQLKEMEEIRAVIEKRIEQITIQSN
jgi:hypothetical protein